MSGKDIAKAFRSASRKAGDTALSNGRSVVVKRGRHIVSLSRGRAEKIVHTLPKAYVHSHAKSYKVK